MNRYDIVRDLLIRHGTPYATEAGIALRDKPAPLYQLLVLTTLASAPIRASIAAAAARELFSTGWGTPDRMRATTWQQRVEVLGRGGYRRYDESAAVRIADGATRVLEEYDGDLRRIRPHDRSGVPALRRALTGFPGIGPTGADIYCHEVQGVWPAVAPYFDARALQTADELSLPTDPGELGDLVATSQLPSLASALLRVG